MKTIRESLEKKKFIRDEGMADAPQEEIENAYALFLKKTAEEDLAAALLADSEKAKLKEKQAAERAQKDAYAQSLIDFETSMRDQRMGEKEIKDALKAKRRAHAKEKSALQKAAFQKLREDQTVLRDRKKVFL